LPPERDSFSFLLVLTFVFSNSSAKLVCLQELIVPYKEKRVSKREKVSLTEIARLTFSDEMGVF
jgi:hypothetical protein